jgi:hypothetical protein
MCPCAFYSVAVTPDKNYPGWFRVLGGAAELGEQHAGRRRERLRHLRAQERAVPVAVVSSAARLEDADDVGAGDRLAVGRPRVGKGFRHWGEFL